METFVFDDILGTNYLFGSGDLSALAGFEVPFRPAPSNGWSSTSTRARRPSA